MRVLDGGLATAWLASQALASSHLASMSTNDLFQRDINDFDAEDLSFIKKFAAIGDSYSAGIGSGSLLERDYHGETVACRRRDHRLIRIIAEFNCRRYDHSYPWLIHQDPRLGDEEDRDFQFESCSGALTQDVIDDQIPELNSGQQIIMVSAGMFKARHAKKT